MEECMMFQITGIDHVQLAAPEQCEEEARKFYGSILGMTEIEKPENLKKRGGVWFQCGSHQLHIGVQEDHVPARKAHPALCVQNVLALREHLQQCGIETIDDQPLEGAIRFYVNDPFGNRIEFLEWLNRKE
jgi:catechol 2,3-dioxygenase-like lactoylglutathione lyase family enzyme